MLDLSIARPWAIHRDGTLAAIRLRVSKRAGMESLDNQIGVIEHWACGSHSFADFAAMLFPAAAP
jgi:hypothetical protein